MRVSIIAVLCMALLANVAFAADEGEKIAAAAAPLLPERAPRGRPPSHTTQQE